MCDLASILSNNVPYTLGCYIQLFVFVKLT